MYAMHDMGYGERERQEKKEKEKKLVYGDQDLSARPVELGYL